MSEQETGSQPRRSREEILAELRALSTMTDLEIAHVEADGLLLELIDDPEISEAYHAIDKWYA